MKVICLPRAMGKTFKLIEMCERDQVIICANNHMREFTKKVAEEMGKKILCETVSSFKLSTIGKNKLFELLIDDADLVLQNKFFPHLVKCITLTEEK